MRIAAATIVIAVASAHADAPHGEHFVGWTRDGRAVIETTTGARSACSAAGALIDFTQAVACEPLDAGNMSVRSSAVVVVKAGAPRDRRGDARIVGAATCKRHAPCTLAIGLVVAGKQVRSWTRDYKLEPDTRPSLAAVYFRGDGKVAVVIVREDRPKRAAETRGFVLDVGTDK